MSEQIQVPQIECPDTSRRHFLSGCVALGSALTAPSLFASIGQQQERSIALHHLHTGEREKLAYWADGEYLAENLRRLNQLLRDHRTGDSTLMDPKLLDLLYRLQSSVGRVGEFQVISGYRSPKSNAMLRGKSNGVAKRSLHMQGKAIDVRLPGTELKELRKAALALKAGGVGFYPKSNFIHVDTGRVRFW
ncbi:DUF882 domain-containing protein [Candidatus Endoriftia persephonae]|jgi:uncharacterized protein YcbK (DUF882 family)|uniref:Murein endopeptidase K n=2 Tax=Gammaproteobacteria TaxID=1236 RepID=G2FFR6_9GAMM|nr:DUF882 domain-containing protein [Candidatus Endoriftia persephone]EGW54318.1 uncharacterized protein YcbK [endosymbiont of Tevnia jerichonana (vent Tica)]USF87020.1 DUF882 domain-containing protein [Candidatus Endoriftia persephone]